MANPPEYPKDAPVGAEAKADPRRSAAPVAETEPSQSSADNPGSDPRRKKHLMAGAAIGIGSAAIVAALLYANRGRRTDKS